MRPLGRGLVLLTFRVDCGSIFSIAVHSPNQSPAGDKEAVMPALQQSKAKPAIYRFTVTDSGPHTSTREWENHRFKEWGWVSFRELQEVTGRSGTALMEQYGNMHNGWWYARYRRRWNHPLLLVLKTDTPKTYDSFTWEPGHRLADADVERITFVPAGWALQIIQDERKPTA